MKLCRTKFSMKERLLCRLGRTGPGAPLVSSVAKLERRRVEDWMACARAESVATATVAIPPPSPLSTSSGVHPMSAETFLSVSKTLGSSTGAGKGSTLVTESP